MVTVGCKINVDYFSSINALYIKDNEKIFIKKVNQNTSFNSIVELCFF